MKNVQHGSLFSQLLSLFNRNDFSRHVRDLEAEYGSKGFSCWDQFVSMLFCHLAQAKSLREITQGLKSSQGRLSHLGMKEAPKRSTLSYANQHRTWELYERLFYDLLQVCKEIAPRKNKKFRFKNKLMSIDASIIELCIEMFDWAKYRKAKGAGAKVYRYTDGFLHAKTILIDDGTSAVGTTNLDNRSLRLNFEITAWVYDKTFAAQMEQMYLNDFEKARLMTSDYLAQRPWWFKVAVRFARLTAPIQ